MNNPIAQLLAQAETGLSDFSRRAVESVTLPIKAKSQELVADVGASVKASLLAIAVKAGLGLFAGVMGLIALGYGLSALHSYLATLVGPIEATLIMAGVFLALAILAILALVIWPSSAKATASANSGAKAVREAEAAIARARTEVDASARAAKAQARPAASIDAAAEAPPSAMGDVKSGLGAIASALGAAGFRREQAGLRAGLAIAEQLKPMQIVSLALVGGFLAGVRHRRRG